MIIITTKMGNADLDLELTSLLHAAQNTALLVYELHRRPFLMVVTVLLAYVAFRVGRMTVVDPL